jgi:6-phospho-3-hexuloisomerase
MPTGFQERAARVLGEVGAVVARVEPREVEELVHTILRTRRLFLEGRGRSGLMMRAFAMRLTHLDIHCHVVGESTTPGLQPGDLLLAGSGSGETVTAVLAARMARDMGGSIAVLTSRLESTLARFADQVVLIPAPVRESSEIEPVNTEQPMGSLFEQSLLMLLDTIVLMLKDRLQQDEASMMARHSNLE